LTVMPRYSGGLVKIAHPYGMDVAQTETRSQGFSSSVRIGPWSCPSSELFCTDAEYEPR
jgi:hypothetical protein